MYLHTSLHYHTQYISGSQLLHCKCSTTTSLPKAAFSMIHNLPYSWYTPNTVFIMHRWNVSRKIDCHPLLISIVKARLQIQKVIHSLPLLFFSFVQNSRSICVAFIFLSRKKKQKLDLRGYLAILWPFKKMIRGRRYQNTALRHDPKDADIWYFMGTSHTMSAGKLSSL